MGIYEISYNLTDSKPTEGQLKYRLPSYEGLRFSLTNNHHERAFYTLANTIFPENLRIFEYYPTDLDAALQEYYVTDIGKSYILPNQTIHFYSYAENRDSIMDIRWGSSSATTFAMNLISIVAISFFFV